MSEKEIYKKIVENAEHIAKAISRGKDVEVVKTSTGLAIKEVTKKKIS